MDAWRDALLKVKAARARTGGGWRADVAGRTRQTSARLLESAPLDEASLDHGGLSPREQRLQRIVHEVGVFTVEQGRLQGAYDDSLKYRPPEDADYLGAPAAGSAAEVEARLKDHTQQMTMRKAVLAMAEAQATLNDAKATRLASAWHGGGGVRAASPESLVQRAAAAAEEACFTAYQAVDDLEAVASDAHAWAHSADGAHAAWSHSRQQLVRRRARAARESQLAELRSWTKDAYGKVKHALRAEHQALSWLSEAATGGNSSGGGGGGGGGGSGAGGLLSGGHNLSYITASAAQMAASMSAQAAALKPILEVLGNRSASRAAQLDAKLSTPSTKALGLESAAAGEESSGTNGRERLGAHEVSELEKAQRLVGQAERDQQAALAALTLARKAEEHGSRLVASQGRSSQLTEVQQVLRNHPEARRVVANYTRERNVQRMATELVAAAEGADDDDPPQPCTDMPCKAKAAAKAAAAKKAKAADDDDDPPTPCTDTNVGNCAKRGADDAEEEEPEEPEEEGEDAEADEAEAAAFGEEEGDDDPTPCTDWGVPPCKEGEVPKGQAAPEEEEEDADEEDGVSDGAGWKRSAMRFAGKNSSSQQADADEAPVAGAWHGMGLRNGSSSGSSGSTGLRRRETAPAPGQPEEVASSISRVEDAADVAVKAKEEAEVAGAAAKDAADAEAEATRAAEAASKAAEVAKANAFAADEDAKAKVAAEEAANAEKAAAAAKAEAEAIKAEAVKAEASVFAGAPPAGANASDVGGGAVVPGADAASTELQPDATPPLDPTWSGRHTAILLIAITLSLFLGYALAYIYRRLSDGKKARLMDEARMDDEAARAPSGPSSPRMEAASA